MEVCVGRERERRRCTVMGSSRGCDCAVSQRTGAAAPSCAIALAPRSVQRRRRPPRKTNQLTATSSNFASRAAIAEPSSPNFAHLFLSFSPVASLSLSLSSSLSAPPPPLLLLPTASLSSDPCFATLFLPLPPSTLRGAGGGTCSRRFADVSSK